MLKCKVCGCEFPAIVEKRYTSRENQRNSRLSSIYEVRENTLFDSFDCPQCGCQYIAQERQPAVLTSTDGDDK